MYRTDCFFVLQNNFMVPITTRLSDDSSVTSNFQGLQKCAEIGNFILKNSCVLYQIDHQDSRKQISGKSISA